MSLSNLTIRSLSAGDAVEVDFTIPGDIIVDDSTEVLVYVKDENVDPTTETLQVENSDYTLTGAADVNSFHTTVTFTTAPASTDKVLIIRSLPLTQTLDANANSSLSLLDHETAYDRIVAQVQQLQEQLDRSIKLPLTSSTTGLELPEPVAGKTVIWNTAADALENQSATEYFDRVTAEYSVTDGQSASSLSGETFDGTVYTSAVFDYEIIRGTTVFTSGRFTLQYLNSTWRLEDGGGEGSASGVTFSVTQSTTIAQLKAALDVGAGNGTIKLKRHYYAV